MKKKMEEKYIRRRAMLDLLGFQAITLFFAWLFIEIVTH